MSCCESGGKKRREDGSMIVHYVEVNSGYKERILPAEISDITTAQFRTLLPKAAEDICEMQYGTGFHLELLPGGYQAYLYDLRGEEPALFAVTAGVWEPGLRLELWKEFCGCVRGEEKSGKILEIPPAVPYIVDYVLPGKVSRTELTQWRRSFSQGLGWTIFGFYCGL